jgi:hypothetical protein
MSEQKHLPWNEGLPTAPDVNAIREKWPELKVGDRVLYSDISALLKIEIGSHRFRSVTTAWRKREEQEGRVIQCEKKTAFYVASADQTSSMTHGVLQSIGRKAKKHRKHLSIQKADDPQLQSTMDHQGRLMHAVERETKKARMNLLPSPAPVAEHPQIAPPSAKDARKP